MDPVIRNYRVLVSSYSEIRISGRKRVNFIIMSPISVLGGKDFYPTPICSILSL